MKILRIGCVFIFIVACTVPFLSYGQFSRSIKWSNDGNSYYELNNLGVIYATLPGNQKKILFPIEKLNPAGSNNKLLIQDFFLSADNHLMLIFTNSKRVWRYNTRGDYWVYNLKDSSLLQLGKLLPSTSLMFAKISPDGTKAAYVSNYNLYVEDLSNHTIKQLTFDGSRQLINGTFDYLYEEEFDCRDGFRWSPDSRKIAYWQIDARSVKDYQMLNTTDSVYPKIIPVGYSVAGEKPSLFKIGIADINTAQKKWMEIPTDTALGSYVPRMEWAANSHELVIQHLNRQQNESKLMLCNVDNVKAYTIYTEKDSAWIDILSAWDGDYKMGGWNWIQNGKEFICASEKDGWRHLYMLNRDGKKETLITKGNYDVMSIAHIDDGNGYVYFMASPDNATQSYLYRTKLNGMGQAQLLSPTYETGTHIYNISPNGKYAQHTFSNYYTYNTTEFITLPDHKSLDAFNTMSKEIAKANKSKSPVSYFQVKNAHGVKMDAYMVKPDGFDSTKKYPVVFFVYGGPALQTVTDEYGAANNELYRGSMTRDGYIYISIDNEGTPVPKGRAWRKSIYGKLGQIDVEDQAAAAEQIRHWPFVDSNRIAVWGWSNGGTLSLNLIFRYPGIYKTAIAISPITNFELYDNIYTERIMGLPQQNKAAYINGSPVTYAKNLVGNLLLIHGSGDDNVHYAHTEILLNALIKYDKLFQFMEYPNRTHNISEGLGTRNHLSNLYTSWLRAHCPGGPR